MMHHDRDFLKNKSRLSSSSSVSDWQMDARLDRYIFLSLCVSHNLITDLF